MRTTSYYIIRCIQSIFLLLTLSYLSAQMDTVTSTADAGAGTLRDLISSSSNGDTIVFAESINGDSIFLTTGEISISNDLVILGNGSENIIIDGSQDVGRDSRIFFIPSNREIYLSGMTLSNAGDTTLGSLFGGAIVSDVNSELTIEDCVFKNNKAFLGGAFRISEGGTFIANRCSFIGNESEIVGGAINTRGDENRITNCLFAGNISGSSAGALAHEVGTLHLFNSTFTDNESEGSGAAIEKQVDIDSLVNCIFYNNKKNGLASDIEGFGTIVKGLNNNIEEYSGTGLMAGVDGNISEDPEFTGAGDYSLKPGSLCIDAGTNLSESEPTDIRGRSRTVNATQDMGAYEFFCPLSIQEIYVDIDALGNNDGLVWADAFTDLQDAIDLACDCDTLVSEIWVAEGTYIPQRAFDTDEDGTIEAREESFYINKNVAIYGGFEGGEVLRDERDSEAHQTILSGDLGMTANSSDNSYHVLWIDGTAGNGPIDSTTLIDGFIIQDGFGNQLGDHRNGAGMYLDGNGSGNICSPRIMNCIFSQNRSFYGGAIYNFGSNGNSSPSITNCSFSQNEVTLLGGAIFNYGSGGHSSPSITDCGFWQNEADAFGGAIYNLGQNGNSSPSITNCSFSQNEASVGGAIYNKGSGGHSSPSITNCSFSQNTAGAIRILNSDTISITNCIFWGNEGANGDNEILHTGANGTTLSHSIIDDGIENGTVNMPTNVIDGGNNLDSDPQFVEADSSDLRLLAGSPAINAGNNADIPVGIDRDLQGSFRIMDEHVDMGAYELSGGDCETAVRLSCGDNIIGNANWQDKTLDSLFDCTNNSPYQYYKTTWFTFTGTGDSIKLQLSEYETNSVEIEMHLYNGTCDAINCEAGEYFEEPSKDSINFFTEVGTEYILVIGIYNSNTDSLGEYTLSMTCLCGDENLTYSPPQNFINGDIHKIETNLSITADNLLSTGADIIYDAADGILLNPGFEVKLGAKLLAVPDGCGGEHIVEEGENNKE